MWASLSLLTILAVKANAVDEAPQSYLGRDASLISERFYEFLITPQVTPEPPKLLANIIFADIKVYLGTIVPQCLTAVPPLVSFPGANEKVLYTLINLDIDYPQFGTVRNGTYGIIGFVVNIPGGKILDGETLVPYVAPNPALGSGLHRYLLLIYRQPGPIKGTDELLISLVKNQYVNFNLQEFAKEYKLGNPIAGNFFRTEQMLCESQYDEITFCNGCCDNYGTSRDQCGTSGINNYYPCNNKFEFEKTCRVPFSTPSNN